MSSTNFKAFLKRIIPASWIRGVRNSLSFFTQFGDYGWFFLSQRSSSKSLPTSYVIVGQGRTGSTLLQSLLDSHPDILCQGEIISNDHRSWDRNLFFVEAFVLGRRFRHRNTCYGFKFKFDHLYKHQGYHSPRNFLTLLHERGWKIIYLKRNNYFYHAISQMVAEDNNRQYQHTKEDGILKRQPIVVDKERLLSKLENSRINQIKALEYLEGFPYEEIIYERDLENSRDHQQTLKRLFDFLDQSFHQVETNHIKINDRPLESIIENHNEVRDFLQGTQYEKFLDAKVY